MSRGERKAAILTDEEESLLNRLVDKGLREIKPKIGPEGITYDGLDDIAEEYGTKRLQELLESLTYKGFLIVKAYDRAIFCPNCSSTHIYSKYTCPRCHSINVNRMELIEHPFCGYIGGRDKFVSESSLFCPNCKTDLGPEGGEPPGDGSRLDYKVIGSSFECEKDGCRFDKANVMHICQSCGANFNYRTARYEKLNAYEVPDRVLEILGRVPQINMVLKPIEAALRAKGYKVDRNVLVGGTSGGEHPFDVVALKGSSLVVVDVSIGGSQNDIISMLGKKIDVNPALAILVDMTDNEEVSALGKVYNIVVLNGKDANLQKFVTDSLEGVRIKEVAKTLQAADTKKDRVR